MEFNYKRPRRLRTTEFTRSLVRETTLSSKDLVWPVFIEEGTSIKHKIPSLPGVFRYSVDCLLDEVKNALDLGIQAIALFPKIDDKLKDSHAKEALNSDGLIPRAIHTLKKTFPNLIVIADIALDPYSSDGHDGIVVENKIANDASLEILSEMAVRLAEAGADWVAPSDMMDGRVGAIRRALDHKKYLDTVILSYTAKYASCFYGPFREALDSAPRAGDKKTYQMDPSNRKEALRELSLDIEEGADIVMVKPALSYLDILSDFKRNSTVPVAAYQVSGEYAQIEAAAERGWIDRKLAILETLTSIKRAGADIIFTYYAREAAELIQK
jgi:porphobilinogen synthase